MAKSHREPQALTNVLMELNATHSFSQACVRQVLEDAWNAAVGKPQCYQTKISRLHRGVLNVTVADSILLGELVAFRKAGLIAALKRSGLGIAIHDISFRVQPAPFDAKEK
jgi:Dna[CI] antecedent, DciA